MQTEKANKTYNS